MKVGIMSMQRIKNYGSYLQAYALKSTIESIGHTTEFVDFKYMKSLVNVKKKSMLKRIIDNLDIFYYLRKKRILKKYNVYFKTELIPMLCPKSNNYYPKDIDCLVIGSDEVFNCLQPYPVGYSKDLFGYNYSEIPVLSYAASFGQVNIKRLKEYSISDEIGVLLSRFKSISVRDENSYNTVKALIDKEPYINLDPVLIYDFAKETSDRVKIKDYIIVYAYPERLSKREQKAIKAFAKKHNKKIVSFGMVQKISDIEIVVNPFEIFSYFKHADFIITDTFHGSIFAIKTHSKFCTLIRKSALGNSNKLEDLLKRLNLSDRIIQDVDCIENKYEKDIDYTETDEIIEKEKRKAIEYLKNNID